jgi:tRNA G18 (ribose-2'-O)-methylase SpoU
MSSPEIEDWNWRCPYTDCSSFNLQLLELEDGPRDNAPFATRFRNELARAAVGPDGLPACFCPTCGRPFTPRTGRHFKEMTHKVEIFRELQKHLSVNDRSAFLAADKSGNSPLVVVIEDLRSLHNVGAIFRTADGAGFSRLFLCGITGLPPRKEIAKVSLGAEDFVPWYFYPFITECLSDLAERGYQIVALEKNALSTSLYSSLQSGALRRPLALVVGNEVTGVSHEAQTYCEHICHLTMRGRKESLNVSVAFGAASYLISEFFA